jgi:hypothetical protein
MKVIYLQRKSFIHIIVGDNAQVVVQLSIQKQRYALLFA